MNRRQFAIRTAGAVAVAVLPSAALPSVQTTRKSATGSLIIKGGLVFDGLGGPPIEADVAVEGDRIAGVGPDLPTSGADVIEARGSAVCPGFVDIHSHTDLSLLVNPNAESKIRQGVTTEVVGQDGSSIGPWSAERAEIMRARYRDSYDVDLDFATLGGFFSRLERDPPSVNLASMIGLGTVREFVIGEAERAPLPGELATMVAAVQAGLAAGACGVSTGLEYIPGAFAGTGEIIELCKPLAGTGLPYASHMRNEDDTLFAAIEEALHVGRVAQVPIHISHLKAIGQRNWWKPPVALDMLERGAEAGLEITFDRYPYVAYSTTLASIFPVWSREGGTKAFLDRLDDPELHDLIRGDVQSKIDRMGDWNSVQITSTREDSLSWANGARLADLATKQGRDPFELAVHLITSDRNRTAMVGFGMGEENTELFLAHDRGMICSDAGARAPYGPLGVGSPHPRAYGSFPRVLGLYCRDRSLMPLEKAIKKMTSMPSDLIGIGDRGRIAEGVFADLVVFDPDTVNDLATFTEPHQYPTGIEYVLVNGQTVIERGEHTESRAGRVLRPGG